MQIAKDKVALFEYTLKVDGEVLETTMGEEAASYIHGYEQIVPGLEKALEGREAGNEFSVDVAKADAYGDRDEGLVIAVEREAISVEGDILEGMEFSGQSPDGGHVLYTVTNVEGSQITLDGNHPLVGKDLSFDIKVTEVRDASEEEISHGHVHGAHGHHHHEHGEGGCGCGGNCACGGH